MAASASCRARLARLIGSRAFQTVAAEAGVQVAEQELYSDSLGEAGSGAETYVAMMRLNTCTIVAALGGSPDCP